MLSKKNIKESNFAFIRKILVKDAITDVNTTPLTPLPTQPPTAEQILATMAPDVRALYHTEPELINGFPNCSQPVCKPDARMTIQVNPNLPVHAGQVPWRLPNSFRGYLIMSPGGTGGTIGGLLYQMNQYYSHMGIVTKELPMGLGAYEVRHATGHEGRMQDFPHRDGDDEVTNAPLHYHGHDGLANAPTDGFQETALRNGWPGTISQSVQEIVTGDTDAEHPRQWTDLASTEKYPIHELTLGSKYMQVKGHGYGKDGATVIVDALNVRPPNGRETPAVVNALSRITDEANNINGHYRFFCYTEGNIGMNAAYDGILLNEENVSNPDPFCKSKKIATTKTKAVVCSSFIWTAVQIANQKAAGTTLPQIILDGRPDFLYDTTLVGTEHFRRDWDNKDIFNPPLRTPVDGLYFYNEELRTRLSKWLYEAVRGKVISQVEESTDLKSWLAENAQVEGIDIYKVLSTFSLGVSKLILGITDAGLAFLVRIFSDIPSDIASQITNSFANDDCSVSAKDSDAYEKPGTGLAVSPDDIINYWTYPTIPRPVVEHTVSSNVSGKLLGVYGWNTKLQTCPPLVLQNVPHFFWDIALGECTVEGNVTYSDKDPFRRGQGVTGARIYIGCTVITTSDGGGIRGVKVPSGKYTVRAVYDDPITGLLWQSPLSVEDFTAGGNKPLLIKLDPPAAVNREVIVSGHWDIRNEHVIGHWEGSYDDDPKSKYLGSGIQRPNPFFDADSFSNHSVDDWGEAQVNYQLMLDPVNLSVLIKVQARMENDRDDEWVSFEFTVFAKKDNREPAAVFNMTLTRDAGPWPITGKLQIKVDNNIMPGGLP